MKKYSLSNLFFICVVFLISVIIVSVDGNTTIREEAYACNITDDNQTCNQSYNQSFYNGSVSEQTDWYPVSEPDTEAEDTRPDSGEQRYEEVSDDFSLESPRTSEKNTETDPGSDTDEIPQTPPVRSEKSSGYDFIAMSEQNTAMAQKNQENAQLSLRSSLRGRSSGIGINIFDAPRPVRLPAGWGCGG